MNSSIYKFAGLLALATTFGSALAQPPHAPAHVSKTALKKAIEEILVENPELVRDALSHLERKEAIAKELRAKSALSDNAKDIYAMTGSTVLGNPDGDVTIVEFIDYRCGYCKRLAGSIDEILKLDPKVRVLVKHLPILGPDSLEAARLILATGPEVNKAELHDILMGASTLDAEAIKSFTEKYNVKEEAKYKTAEELQAVRNLADRLGVQGTPAIVVGGSIFFGAIPTEQLIASVNSARKFKK